MTGTGTQADPFIIGSWSDFITAVGTSGAYVELPKNLVRTSDTEVDANKLYVNSSGVVQTNVQPSDLANLYENTFTLDANDYAPAGLTTTITINCTSINGCGGYIKNLASSSVTIFTLASLVTITGIAILNFNLEGQSLFTVNPWQGAYNQYSKCIFSGRLASNSLKYVESTYFSKYTSCSFNVELTGLNVGLFRYLDGTSAELTCCRVNIVKNDAKGNSPYIYIRGNNNYVTGSVPMAVSFCDSAQYSVLDVTAPAVGAPNSSFSSNIANSDKCSSIGNVTPVTTAQLTDAEYLSSIGFPVQI